MISFYSDEELAIAAGELYDKLAEPTNTPDCYLPESVDYRKTANGRAVIHVTMSPPSPDTVIDIDCLDELVQNPFHSSIGPVVTQVTLLETNTVQ